MMTHSSGIDRQPVAFDALPGWHGDDHQAAFAAFLQSAQRLVAVTAPAPSANTTRQVPSAALIVACRQAIVQAAAGQTAAGARAFFEAHFRPHAIVHEAPQGLLTGYYEPELKGGHARSDDFRIPIYRRPADLVNLVDETERGAKSGGLTHARRRADGTDEPYFTRAEIEQGALDGQALELFYFDNPVDVFFMQVQGSGLVALDDGTRVRVSYDGKNGYPYTSIGRYVIEQGYLSKDDMSLAALETWLKADLGRAREVMWRNQSYVFFKTLPPGEDGAPLGSLEIPLTPDRSLAVDTRYHALGTPVFVAAPTLTDPNTGSGFHRLMIAQDVGSAIVGPERGDIYYGCGKVAGARAGSTLHPGNFFVLLPV